jgi:hypothetical protein
MTPVPITDLKLGDVVRLSDIGPFMDATVKQIANGAVTFLRCYVASDFSYTGVICTLGYEECVYLLTHSFPMNRIRKAPKLK